MMPAERQHEQLSELVAEVTDLRTRLYEIADTMDRWARESLKGGWSTHQVRAQRDLAWKIRMEVERP